MVFHPPQWVPQLPIDIPDSVPVAEFMRNEAYGRHPIAQSRPPFTCGLTGKSYSVSELFERSEHLSRAIGNRMGWAPNSGTPWEKVVGIYSFNSINYITACYAVHELSGIVTPANAAYSAAELTHQLKSSGATALFTCVPLLKTALPAAAAAGIPREKVFLLPLPPPFVDVAAPKLSTIDDLIAQGARLPALEPLRWTKGQGALQTAFLCYSSGTSGLPKAVMISHRNVIANVLQVATFELPGRQKRGVVTQNVNGFLPQSHIYALVVISHTCPWRGDGVIVLPKYDFETFLRTVQDYRLEQLILVPPVIVQMLRNAEVLRRYDLSSVRLIISGAAPLGEETISDLKAQYPTWSIGQAYGMTETATVVTWSSEDDIVPRSCGSLVPGAAIRLLDPEGREIAEHDVPGEVLVRAPSVVLGYLNNEKANSDTFTQLDVGSGDGSGCQGARWIRNDDERNRWIRTGDEGLITRSPSGHDHLVIVDRIKELIKVKGHQVAPAELEAHLLAHPLVADCAVIQVPDERSGEVPKAFVVKAVPTASDADVVSAARKHVEAHKAPYKWLRGGIEVVDAIPKSPSGKILRRLLRDQEKARRQKEHQQSKL